MSLRQLLRNGDDEMFCHNCGANAGNAKFCPECGTRIVDLDTVAEKGSGTLTLRKYNAPKMKDVTVDVYIDGVFQTVLSKAESNSFTLPAGTHELLIHADGCVDAIQQISIEPLENRLCIYSIDDVGFINIVQEGSPSRSARYPGKPSSGTARQSGAAVAYAEEPEPMPVTRSSFDYLEETQAQDWQDTQEAAATYAMPQNTKFCKFCGSLIHEESVVCPNCGRQVEELRREEPRVIYQQSNSNNTYVDNRTTVAHGGKPKDKWVAFFLCLFLGYLGIHKFYEGKVGMGILYLFTFGLLGIGTLVDLIAIVMKPNPYYV